MVLTLFRFYLPIVNIENRTEIYSFGGLFSAYLPGVDMYGPFLYFINFQDDFFVT